MAPTAPRDTTKSNEKRENHGQRIRGSAVPIVHRRAHVRQLTAYDGVSKNKTCLGLGRRRLLSLHHNFILFF